MTHPTVKVLIGSQVLARTYESKEFLGDNINYDFIYSKRLNFSFFYRLYASIIFKILSIKYFYKSKTFRYRLVRSTGFFDLLLNLKDHKLDLRVLLFFTLKLIANICISPLALIPRRYISKFNSYIPIGQNNTDIFSECDILIFPFTAFEIEQLFLPTLCKRQKTKLVYIADNWDNLSSKTVILDPPDKMFVWGEQSVSHAKNIQGFTSEIIEIGSSPRLQVYNDVRNMHLKNKVLGFMGAFMYFDEISILNKICEQLPSDWSILYRPHPWAMTKSDFSKISVSPRISIDLDENGKIDHSILATRKFFEKVEITTGGLTTMMLESLLAGRPCIALTIKDHFFNLYSPKSAFNNYTHFEYINKLPHFRCVDDMSNFLYVLSELKNQMHNNLNNYWLDYHVDIKRPASLSRVLKIIS